MYMLYICTYYAYTLSIMIKRGQGTRTYYIISIIRVCLYDVTGTYAELLRNVM